jgi:hypothetical protein
MSKAINVDVEFVLTIDYWNAASRWQDVSWDEQAFAEFVGKHPNHVSGNAFTYVPLPQDKAHRIKLLLGPNYRTIIKVYLLQKSSKK